MTRTELEYMTMDEIAESITDVCNITTRDVLIDFAKEKIDEDNMFLAVHILTAIDRYSADWFDYDYNMGTLEEPTPIESIEDLIDLYGDEILDKDVEE